MPEHALTAGDELFDKTDATFTVSEVHEDGSVTLEIDDGDRIQRTATWDEAEITTALREGLLETSDGKSAELVTA
ncbi:MAG: hypothetical protein ACQEQY_00990 [Halobacteriota archaeon]